jgi:putative membrane protein
VDQLISLKYIVASIVYSMLGILILIFSSMVFDWLTPHKLWDEIVDNKNLPLAIALGAMLIAVGNIIASAIHG